ncbi:DUF2730 family protein [Acidimangrovimonas sediminis]|uniref:DUF2730 family protein n=1 Tax=Acidimangrovimonas sediminis TaxID=2056283 RepID=UPI000C802AF4|nr:DUF2730 family protein [Acidimangrovimonas sediminis]
MPGGVFDISPLVDWIGVLSPIMTFALAVWMLVSSRPRSNADKIEKIEKRQNHQESRIQKLENDLTYLPTKDELHAIDRKMTELHGSLNAVSGQMLPLKHAIENLQKWAMGLRDGE